MADKVSVWLNFDFGFSADYENLYMFLDENKAIECGSNLAYFEKDYKKDFVKHLKKQLSEKIIFKKTDRIYIIIHYHKKILSGFITGSQKHALWEGYAQKQNNNILIDDL
ncbi:MAG: hypothetical protein L3J74_08105 [Bacteroidales bacterium]|nr:hypothetical protein [Bacteroidales bacterium]